MFYTIHDTIEYIRNSIDTDLHTGPNWDHFGARCLLVLHLHHPRTKSQKVSKWSCFLLPGLNKKTMVHNVSVGLPAHKKWLYIVLHSQGHQADFWNQIEFAFAHICTSSDDHLLKIIILKNYHTKAAHVPVEIDSGDFLIAHGASRFLKAEKIMELKRKGKTGPVLHIFILLYPGKWHHCSKPFQN